jgi:DNA-binding NarL/FixJ family response regulator
MKATEVNAGSDVPAKIRTLVVDDSPTVLLALRREVSFHNSLEIVGTAIDGLEAFAAARMLKPQLIVMDIEMPQMTGVESALMIREIQPDARIILTSGSTPTDIKAFCQASGVDAFIPKPELPAELGPAIRRLCPPRD